MFGLNSEKKITSLAKKVIENYIPEITKSITGTLVKEISAVDSHFQREIATIQAELDANFSRLADRTAVDYQELRVESLKVADVAKNIEYSFAAEVQSAEARFLKFENTFLARQAEFEAEILKSITLVAERMAVHEKDATKYYNEANEFLVASEKSLIRADGASNMANGLSHQISNILRTMELHNKNFAEVVADLAKLFAKLKEPDDTVVLSLNSISKHVLEVASTIKSLSAQKDPKLSKLPKKVK